MADAEEKDKAEKLAAAKKRVRVLSILSLQTQRSFYFEVNVLTCLVCSSSR
jgi:hypothetical protein